MSKTLSICGLTATYGTKVQGFINIMDTKTQMPVTLINGEKDGKTILITAGIHGCEYTGIQTAIDIALDLNPKEISGQVVIIHPVNTSGFLGRNPGIVPEDNKNINRVFPGNEKGTITDKIAYTLTHEFQDIADFYLDLHGGDLHEDLTPYVYYPGVGDPEVIAASKSIAEILNVDYMVRSSATTGAYNSAAIRGIPSLLIERGCCGLCKQKDVLSYKKDIVNALIKLGLLEGELPSIEKSPKEIREVEYLATKHTGCWIPFVKSGELLVKGQVLGVVKDYFGNVIDTYYSEFNSVVLYCTVAFSVIKDDSLVTYGRI